MSTIYFRILTKKNPSQIYVRLIRGKTLDVILRTHIFINPAHWDAKRQRVRNVASAIGKDLINATLDKLVCFLLENANKDYIYGIHIDKYWAKKKVLSFFNQGDQKDLYFRDYIESYIKKAPTIFKRSGDKTLSKGTIERYKVTLNKLKNFEDFKEKKLRYQDIHLNFHREFLNYLKEKELLNLTTIGTYIKNIKVFARSAKSEGYPISKEIEHRDFFTTYCESKNIYLTDKEINRLFDLNLESERLINTRDNAIIGLRTGLRVSDFLALELSDIKEDFIEISTKKTSHKVVIPLHFQVKSILKRRQGLPKQISDSQI
jgi:integrase